MKERTMLENLLNYLENKKILILGFGKEGESSYLFLRNHFPDKQLFIADSNMNLLESKKYLLEDINVEVSLGNDYFKDVEYYDLILKTPGISLKDYDISTFEDKITSQLELLLEFVQCFTIGITGTKGKSTTSTVIYSVLKAQGKEAMLLGNIGEPIFNDIDKITENTIVVIELSSHALEYVKKSPNIAILLDIYEEHLDHYKSMNHYIAAKFNCAKFQNNNDVFIYNAKNDYMRNYKFDYKQSDFAVLGKIENEVELKNLESKNCVFIENNNIYCNDKIICSSDIKMNLKGEHNLNNMLFAIAVSEILGLNLDSTLKVIKEFKGLEHRLEFVANIDGVKYYNDSIATIPEATINDVNALGEVNTIIVGGKDRGVDLTELCDFLMNSDIENIICLPKTGEYIYSKIESKIKECSLYINENQDLKNVQQEYNANKVINKKIYLVETMQEAVEKAKEVTKKEKICLLSPAAASYGYFKNFEERGKIFKECVLKVKDA
jgi:UDP-N-acetylmuramoylalanine--D-glutamate ligase